MKLSAYKAEVVLGKCLGVFESREVAFSANGALANSIEMNGIETTKPKRIIDNSDKEI